MNKALIISAILLGVIVVVVPGIFVWVPLMTIYRADEGFKRARRTINPEDLRQWALQEISKRSGTNAHYIPTSEIPDSIQKLYSRRPEGAEAVSGAVGKQSCVIILWGGGFFHWVITVGDTNFSEPFRNENGEYPYNFEWTNGIYYSHEARWKLW